MEEEQIKMVEISPAYWALEFPDIVWQNEALFLSAYPLFDTEPKKAEMIYRQVLANCGDLYIDANVHLGILLNKHMVKGSGIMYIMNAFVKARLLFPDAFITGRDLLPWKCTNNRHLIHAYHAMALELVKVKKLGEARDLFDFLLKINPADEQGSAAWITKIQKAIDKTGSEDLFVPPDWSFFKRE